MDERDRLGERIAYTCMVLLLIGVAVFLGWVIWRMV